MRILEPANSISRMTSFTFPWLRALWALGAVALVVFCLSESATRGWSIGGVMLAFAILPDLALIGAHDPARRGALRPSRVGFYNAAHRVWAPLALIALGAAFAAPVFAAGVAWLAHIACDRAFGYGLRAPDGSIRPVGGVHATTPCST